VWYLEERGVTIVGLNVDVAGGEIDIVGVDRGTRVAYEVRSRFGGSDPVDAAGAGKRSHVAALARAVGAARADLIGIRIDPKGFDLHWVPGLS
jgi:Holliday junction resolvase-like predicted endonuclease